MTESFKLKSRSIPLSDTHVQRLRESAKRASEHRDHEITWTERCRDLVIDGLTREEAEAAA